MNAPDNYRSWVEFLEGQIAVAREIELSWKNARELLDQPENWGERFVRDAQRFIEHAERLRKTSQCKNIQPIQIYELGELASNLHAFNPEVDTPIVPTQQEKEALSAVRSLLSDLDDGYQKSRRRLEASRKGTADYRKRMRQEIERL